MNKKLSQEDLKKHIEEFLNEHRGGSLGTSLNNVPRSSPVQYFTDPDMNIYILSAGGDKFKAIEQNPNVCLLVNTEYINYKKIKGVQIFGRAAASTKEPGIMNEAQKYAPEPCIIENEKSYLKAIKIIPDEIVYLDSLKDGDRTKQVYRKNPSSHIVALGNEDEIPFE